MISSSKSKEITTVTKQNGSKTIVKGSEPIAQTKTVTSKNVQEATKIK